MFRIQRTVLGASLSSVVLAAGMMSAAWAGTNHQTSNERGLPAGTYTAFRNDINDIAKMRLDQPENIHKAQAALVAFNETDLSHGFVAHMAQVAASSDRFQRGLKRAARRYGGRDKLIAHLEQDPRTIYNVSGWQEASQNVASAIERDNAAMSAVAYRLNEIAYGRTAGEARHAQEARNASTSTGITGATRAPRHARTSTMAMSQILALGGVMSLTHTRPAQLTPAAASIAVNPTNDQCLRWADLNLKQCLAAAHDNNERAKCWVSVATPAS
jgi:hypothetical protein